MIVKRVILLFDIKPPLLPSEDRMERLNELRSEKHGERFAYRAPSFAKLAV